MAAFHTTKCACAILERMSEKDLEGITDFLYEVGILSKTPRSFVSFLGSGEQSVAEHINRVGYIAYCLAKLNGEVDTGKVLQMALFHDVSESRISDLNYVHQKYTERLEEKAHNDLAASLPFGDDVLGLINEYEDRETAESQIVKDADILELILSLKEQYDIGNKRAKEWIDVALKRLKTREGQELGAKIVTVDSDRWWFGEKDDSWWIHRNKE